MMINRTRIILGLFLAVAVVAAYSNCFGGVFIFDDYVSILGNWRIRSAWSCFMETTRPLTNLSFYIHYVTGGLRAADCHAVNLAIHLSAVLLLFSLLNRVLLLPYFGRMFKSSSIFIAFFAALLWGVHPLQTESVTYICQRSESMMGFFYLLTIYALVRSATGSNTILWQSIAVVASLLGMAAKPVMITVPLVALLFDRTFLSGSFMGALKARWRLYAGLILAVALPAALLLGPNESSTSAGFGVEGMSPSSYFMTEQGVILHYLRLALFPYPLCLDYGWQAVDGYLELLLPSLIVSALLAFTVVACLKKWSFGFLGAWFFLVLAPTSSFFPVSDPAFEHRMYLPLMAVIVAGVLIIDFGGRVLADVKRITLLRARMFAGICMLLMALALGGLTFLRNLDYSSEERMWRSCLDVSKFNMRLYSALGSVYAGQGRYADASKCFERVREVAARGEYRDKTVLSMVSCNMGTMRHAQGMNVEAEALYREALSIAGKNSDARNNLGKILQEKGEIKKALAEWMTVLHDDPYNLAAMHSLGMAMFRLKRTDLAFCQLEAALDLYPDADNVRIDALWVRLSGGGSGRSSDLDKVIAMASVGLSRANLSDATKARYYHVLAEAHIRSGRYELALTEIELAIALNRAVEPFNGELVGMRDGMKRSRPALGNPVPTNRP